MGRILGSRYDEARSKNIGAPWNRYKRLARACEHLPQNRCVERVVQTHYQVGGAKFIVSGIPANDLDPTARPPLSEISLANLRELGREFHPDHALKPQAAGDQQKPSFAGTDVPAYSKYSPGMYLLLSSINDLCDRKWDEEISRVDFGLEAEYKAVLSNCSFEEGSVHLYGRTLRGVGVNVLSAPVLLADRWARKFLAKNNLLAKIKRIWRDRAVRNTACPSKAVDSA